MQTIWEEICRALGYLFIAYIVFLAWKISCEQALKIGYKKVLLQGFLWCAGIALFGALTLGTHIERDENADPIYGSAYTVEDYKPTTNQRVASFAYFFTLIYIPVAIGASGKKPKFLESEPKY